MSDLVAYGMRSRIIFGKDILVFCLIFRGRKGVVFAGQKQPREMSRARGFVHVSFNVAAFVLKKRGKKRYVFPSQKLSRKSAAVNQIFEVFCFGKACKILWRPLSARRRDCSVSSAPRSPSRSNEKWAATVSI